MIYAIDNGELSIEDREIEFVEADPDFGEWWNTLFVPWLRMVDRNDYVLFTCDQVTWWDRGGRRGKGSPTAVADYLLSRRVGYHRGVILEPPRYNAVESQFSEGGGI